MPYNRKIKKVELSPKLKLGVGRGPSSVNILKISGTIFLVLALVLIVNSVLVLTRSHSSTTTQGQGQVLGASDTASATTQQPNNNFIIHTVISGDTVFSIAQKYGVSWSTVATLNNLNPPFTLKIGQELKIPKQ